MKTKRPQNALIHGAYAADTILPWEDPEEFAALHQAIRQELTPSGPLEEAAVREIAELHWRKQRLAIGLVLPYFKDVPPAELIEAARGGVAALAAYLANPANPAQRSWVLTGSEALDLVKRKIAGASSAAPNPPSQSATPPGPGTSVIERAYDLAAMERALKVEAMIDSRVAKAMGRLVGLKEYKLIYVPEPVTLPTVPAPTTPPLAPSAEVSASPAPPHGSTPPAINANEPTKSGWTARGRRT